jgi:hypothetical protein
MNVSVRKTVALVLALAKLHQKVGFGKYVIID